MRRSLFLSFLYSLAHLNIQTLLECTVFFFFFFTVSGDGESLVSLFLKRHNCSLLFFLQHLYANYSDSLIVVHILVVFAVAGVELYLDKLKDTVDFSKSCDLLLLHVLLRYICNCCCWEKVIAFPSHTTGNQLFMKA